MSSFVVHPEMKKHFGYCLVKTGQLLKALLDQDLQQLKITTPEFSTLRIADLSGPTSQIDIGRYLGMDRASVVKLIDGLEQKGLVHRISSKDDRRVKLIGLTPKGKPFLTKAIAIRDECERKFLSLLSTRERESLRKLVSKLLQSA